MGEAFPRLSLWIFQSMKASTVGSHDQVASMGMFEYVCPRHYRMYFETAERLLKAGAFFLLHTIGSNKSTDKIDPWADKYILPKGVSPSIAKIGGAIEGLFMVEDWHNFGADYDKTLMAWQHNHDANWDTARDKYGEGLHCMWSFSLRSCAAGFRVWNVQRWQVVMAKRGVERNGPLTIMPAFCNQICRRRRAAQ